MARTPDRTPAPHQRVNDLYWNSDDPVRKIAETVGMSRSAVYTAIQPVSAGVRSPNGDAYLVFTNRSNREAGLATCPLTGSEIHLEDAAAADRDRPAPSGMAAPEPAGRTRSPSTVAAAVDPEKTVLVVGAALVGLLLGVLGIALGRRLS